MEIKSLNEILQPDEPRPDAQWELRLIKSDDCQSYIAWNTLTAEAIVVDPKLEDLEAYRSLAKELKGYLWLSVIDTHTHADHISAAAQLAHELKAPLVMHESAPSRRVDFKLSSKLSSLSAKSSPVTFLHSPGHTGDSITVFWGPFIFGGDTVLYGDSGRDDLPGGDEVAHYESLVKIKELATPEMIFLGGHDFKSGRASTWGTQLKMNTSLTQSRDEFIRDAGQYVAAAPKLLKESLKENFK